METKPEIINNIFILQSVPKMKQKKKKVKLIIEDEECEDEIDNLVKSISSII